MIGHESLRTEALPGAEFCCAPHIKTSTRIRQQVNERLGDRPRICRNDQTGHLILHDLRRASDVGGDAGNPRHGSLDQGHRHTFIVRTDDHHIRRGIQRRYVRSPTDEPDRLAEALRVGSDLLKQIALSGDHQRGIRNLRHDLLESGEEPVGTLDAGQPPDEQHDRARGRQVVERPGVGRIQNSSSGPNSRCDGRELVRRSNPGCHELFANTLADGHQRGGMTGEDTLDHPDEARGQR